MSIKNISTKRNIIKYKIFKINMKNIIYLNNKIIELIYAEFDIKYKDYNSLFLCLQRVRPPWKIPRITTVNYAFRFQVK